MKDSKDFTAKKKIPPIKTVLNPKPKQFQATVKKMNFRPSNRKG